MAQAPAASCLRHAPTDPCVVPWWCMTRPYPATPTISGVGACHPRLPSGRLFLYSECTPSCSLYASCMCTGSLPDPCGWHSTSAGDGRNSCCGQVVVREVVLVQLAQRQHPHRPIRRGCLSWNFSRFGSSRRKKNCHWTNHHHQSHRARRHLRVRCPQRRPYHHRLGPCWPASLSEACLFRTLFFFSGCKGMEKSSSISSPEDTRGFTSETSKPSIFWYTFDF